MASANQAPINELFNKNAHDKEGLKCDYPSLFSPKDF